jgi:hypothetical protein
MALNTNAGVRREFGRSRALVRVYAATFVAPFNQRRTAFSAVIPTHRKTVMNPADLCLVRPVRDQITVRSSAKYLDQLRVKLDRTDTSKPIPKSRVAALGAIREIAWESDLRFA